MSTDLDIKALVEQQNSFIHANSVNCALPIRKLVTSCLEWERKGVPFVLQGVSSTGSETPFGSSTRWLKTLSNINGQLSQDLSEVDFKMSF
jgi:hypothetical protein